MGNASDTSDAFSSKISKEHDFLIGSIYSVFCKFAAFRRPSGGFLSCQGPRSVFCCPRPGVLSLMGNCILLLVAHHKRSTLKPAEFFIVNLSISDLGMTLTLFPLAIPSSFSHRCERTMDTGAKLAPQLLFRCNLTSSRFVQNQKWEKRGKGITESPGFLRTATFLIQRAWITGTSASLPSLSPSSLSTGGCLGRSPVSSTPPAACCSACVV